MSKIDDDALKLINQDKEKYSYNSPKNPLNKGNYIVFLCLLGFLGLGAYYLIQSDFFTEESDVSDLSDQEILAATTNYLNEETIYIEASCDTVKKLDCTEDNCKLGKYQVTCHTNELEFEITTVLTKSGNGREDEFSFTVLTDTIHRYTP